MLQGKLVLLALLCFAFALQAWGACTKFGVVSLSRSKKYFLSRYWIDLISFLHLPQPNTTPIDRTPLKLLRQVPNGKLYLAGSGEDTIYVVHVYGRQGPSFFLPSLNSPHFSTKGDPYDWGVAEGLLLKNEINYVLPNFLIHLEQTIEKAIPGLPDVRLLRLYFRELTPL